MRDYSVFSVSSHCAQLKPNHNQIRIFLNCAEISASSVNIRPIPKVGWGSHKASSQPNEMKRNNQTNNPGKNVNSYTTKHTWKHFTHKLIRICLTTDVFQKKERVTVTVCFRSWVRESGGERTWTSAKTFVYFFLCLFCLNKHMFEHWQRRPLLLLCLLRVLFLSFSFRSLYVGCWLHLVVRSLCCSFIHNFSCVNF